MREVIVRFPAYALDGVLDRILPIVPDGVREAPSARGQVELRMTGPHLPPLRDIARAMRPAVFQISERAVPDDWRERRLADYRADPIGDRVVVRPPWAPAPPDGMIDIVLEEGGAFGAGTHPTTRKCLELMLAMTPRRIVCRPRLRQRRSGHPRRVAGLRTPDCGGRPAGKRRRHPRQRGAGGGGRARS